MICLDPFPGKDQAFGRFAVLKRLRETAYPHAVHRLRLARPILQRLTMEGAFACVLLIFGAPLPTKAAEPERPPGDAAPSQERDAIRTAHRPWIWVVKNARASIWLAGGLHMGTARDAAVFPPYLAYYRKASVLYFETLPGSWNDFDAKRLLSQRGMLADRQSLAAKLSKQTWMDLNAAVSSGGSQLTSVLKMEPWMAALTLTRNGYVRAGLKSDNSLETYLERVAIRDKKPLGGLETPKDQILVMADASFADQEDFLRGALTGIGNIQASTEMLRDAWVSGEEPRLQSVLGIDTAETRTGMHRNLIGKRNQQWVRRIQKIAGRGESAMIVVGVEHLVANTDSLPHLLEKAGFSVHRIEAGP